MLLEGLFPPLTTPFHADGRPHWRHLERNVERYSRAPLAGLTILGSTGEAVMLSDDETRQALRVCAEAAAPEKVLLAGVGRESVIETLRLAEEAAKYDYDAVLVRTPHFYRPQMRPIEMLTFYRAVADASPLPVLLYSVPTYTAYDLPVAVAAELAWHPNIVGIKESSGKLERIRELIAATSGAPRRTVTVTSTFSAVTRRMLMVQTEIAAVGNALLPLDALGGGEMLTSPAISAPALKTRTRDVGFQVLCGSAQTLLAALQAGCSGGVVAAASFAPQACAEIYMAWKDKDEALAQQKQERILEAANLICGRLGVPGVKYACDVNGYYGGAPRLPLLPLTGEEKESALRVMANLPH